MGSGGVAKGARLMPDEPDEVMTVYLGREIKNWEYHVANVNAVLRAMKAIAS